MSYYYEDTSHYCYTVPAGYEDTSGYSYSVPADYYNSPPDPIYYDNTPTDIIHYADDTTVWSPSVSPTSYEVEYEHDLGANTEAIYYEEDLHPAYRDPPADDYCEPMRIPTWDELHPAYRDPPADPVYESIQPTMTSPTADNPPHEPIPPLTNSYDEFSTCTDEELEEKMHYYEEMLQEMVDWDIEDEENKALGRIVPGSKPPDQPYRDSDEFKDIARSVEHARATQRLRMEQDGDDGEVDIMESIICSPTHPQPTSPSHHNFNNELEITSPPDILIPNPLPPSPNIWCKPTHHTSPFLVAAVRCHEPRYYFGSPTRRRRQPGAHRTLPPDIRSPKPIPPKPNISIQSLTCHQPRRPPYLRPRRKHPPHSMNQTHPLIPRHHHNVIRRISKKRHPHLP